MELFKLLGTVIVETKDAIDSLEDTKEAAKETSDSVEELGKESKNSGKTTMDSMLPIPPQFQKVAKAGAAVVSAVAAIGTAIVALAESTREYRLEMGKLETAFSSAGHTTEEATETYQTLYSVLGETDRAVEASQHIAKLCTNEEEMKAMTDACIGAFAMFDDSLPIEGLMEAANETAKTGQVTGVLADALNWAGASETEFQERLNACNSERERAALITEEMVALYGDAADAYKKNNKDIIAATAAQEKLNAATARWGAIFEPIVTFGKEALADLINLSADLLGPVEENTEAIAGTSEATEEAAAKVEKLRGELSALQEVPIYLWTDEQAQRHIELTVALEEAENQYEELAEAERLAAEEAANSVSSTAESAGDFSSITEQYVADAMTLFESFGQTYENMYNKVSNFFEPFETASVSVTTSIEKMMAGMQSQIDFNNSYSDNLQALKDYGLGDLSEAFQSYGANGAAYAQAIVDAVEKAGGATTEEGQKIIDGFSDMNQQVEESQGELANTMALMNGEFETELQNLTDKYGIAIAGLDKSEEARTSATNTFESFLQGMNNKIPGILSTMTSFGQQITSALESGIGSGVSVRITPLNGSYIPGYESGLDFVPYDNYLAYLHHGEAVLTKEEAAAWRAGKEMASSGNNDGSGSGGGGVTVIQNIEAVAQTPVELASATAAYFEQARWVT